LQGNWLFGQLNLMTSLQFVNYTYKLHENMPSSNAIANRQLTETEANALGVFDEGSIGDKFYMRDNTANRNYYEFDLVRADRTNSFFQPKIGANYNLTDNINVFGNYAYVQRFVNLGVYYNNGRLNPDAEDEKSNQFELGVGYTSDLLSAKVNGYYTLWHNKSERLQNQSMAGEAGYDYLGRRNELVGTSQHMGVEFAGAVKLDQLLRGLRLNLSCTMMDNKWTEILDAARYDENGNRRVFETRTNADGTTRSFYFDELEGTVVAGGPQTMAMVGLLYDIGDFYTSLSMNYYARDYILSGGTYMAVDGEFSTNDAGQEIFKAVYDNQLPSRALFDCGVGYRFKLAGIRGNLSAQVLNILNTEFLAVADSYGVAPGMLRAFRLNLNIGF
jgi:outer membrane receptor protein involved in Fe transport